MKKKRITISAIIAVGLYAIAPIFAGIWKIGDKQGPVIYLEAYHAPLYIIAHEIRYNIKPRESMVWSLYNRPYFYGFSRRPKVQVKREEIIKRWIKRYPDSMMTKLMIGENNKIKLNKVAPPDSETTAAESE